jgi:hypothetical protein
MLDVAMGRGGVDDDDDGTDISIGEKSCRRSVMCYGNQM